MDLQQSLSVEGQAHVAKVRAQIAAQISSMQLLHARLKAEFWDTMETHSDVLCPLSSGADVENFPLKKEGAEEETAKEAAERRRADMEEMRAESGTPDSDGRASAMDATGTGVLSGSGMQVRSKAYYLLCLVSIKSCGPNDPTLRDCRRTS